MPKISELTPATEFSGDDITVIVREGQTHKIRAADMVEASVDRVIDTIREMQEERWRALPAAAFDPVPLSSSRIETTSTAFSVGLPVRYTVDGTALYGVVSAVNPGSYIDVRGPSINTSKTISEVAMGGAERVAQVDLFLAGTYGTALGPRVANVMKSYSRWSLGPAKLVNFAATHHTVDTTTQPKINILVGGQRVSAADSDLGIQLGASGVWVESPLATIRSDRYSVPYGTGFEIEVTAVAGTGDASGLTVTLTLVME